MIPVSGLPDGGIGFMASRFIATVVLLAPVILIEGAIISWGLKSPFLRAVGASTIVNVVSTLVGFIGGILGLITALRTDLITMSSVEDVLIDLAVALPITIVTEFLMLRLLFRDCRPGRVWLVTLVSNGVTYALLFFVAVRLALMLLPHSPRIFGGSFKTLGGYCCIPA